MHNVLTSVWNNLLYVNDFIQYRNYFTLHDTVIPNTEAVLLKCSASLTMFSFPFVSLHVLKKTSLKSVKRVFIDILLHP